MMENKQNTVKENERELTPFEIQIVECFFNEGHVGISLIQRKFNRGYATAKQLMKGLVDKKIVTELEEGIKYDLLITKEEFEKIK